MRHLKYVWGYLILSTVILFILLLLLVFLLPSEKFLDIAINILGLLLTASITFLIYEFGHLDSHKNVVKEQIKLLDGLIAEIDILIHPHIELPSGQVTEGNLIWYKKYLQPNTPLLPDHKINKINVSIYVSSLDSSLCTEIKIANLVRTLSLVNDKISQLYFHFFEIKDFKERQSYLSEIINESFLNLNLLKKDLLNQRKILLNNIS